MRRFAASISQIRFTRVSRAWSLSRFQYALPSETFRKRVDALASVHDERAIVSWTVEAAGFSRNSTAKIPELSSMLPRLFFRGNFTRRRIPSEIPVKSVRPFIPRISTSTLKKEGRKKKIWGKMETAFCENF